MDVIKDFLKPEVIWFLIGILLLIMEFVLPGLIVFFFGVGACIVGVTCIFRDISINAQLIIFISSSVLSLALLRKWLKGIFLGHTTSKQELSEDMKDFIGQRAVVREKITPNLPGKVELHGTNWQAQADEEIEEGTAVEIISKENLTLKVKAL
ncbi:MAG: NfeD family protein [Planctomycetota bacterium]|jgi:membrane protein implicated in regulation of membrane protease activity